MVDQRVVVRNQMWIKPRADITDRKRNFFRLLGHSVSIVFIPVTGIDDGRRPGTRATPGQ